jgi:hypothetical protein
MANLRGVDPFPLLWERRTTFDLGEAGSLEALSLTDLVLSKKTQRDKDWVMIRRLLEASYARDRDTPTREQVVFWLRELRTAEILIGCALAFPDEAARVAAERPATAAAAAGDMAELEAALAEEEQRVRRRDREYWLPLRAELEQMRRDRR